MNDYLYSKLLCELIPISYNIRKLTMFIKILRKEKKMYTCMHAFKFVYLLVLFNGSNIINKKHEQNSSLTKSLKILHRKKNIHTLKEYNIYDRMKYE